MLTSASSLAGSRILTESIQLSVGIIPIFEARACTVHHEGKIGSAFLAEGSSEMLAAAISSTSRAVAATWHGLHDHTRAPSSSRMAFTRRSNGAINV